MTLKQLAERIGVLPQQLSLEIGMPCRACKKLGGTEKPCEKFCAVKLLAVVVEK